MYDSGPTDLTIARRPIGDLRSSSWPTCRGLCSGTLKPPCGKRRPVRGLYLHLVQSVFTHVSCMYTCLYGCRYEQVYLSIMAATQKHRACNRPGRPFCDKARNRIEGLATNPPCDKPSEDCSTLHRGPRQGVCNREPATQVCNKGGGPRQPLISSHTLCIYMCMRRSVYTLINR